MKMIENVETIKQQLLALGFEDGLEQALLFQLCFLPEQFLLRHRKRRGPDTLVFTLHFERIGNAYDFRFYDAGLQKPISFDDAGGYSDLCLALDEKMKMVDWKNFNVAVTLESARLVETIMMGLAELSENDLGKEFADRLRFKHWMHTDLEYKVQLTQPLRSRFETSQRFYFFEGEDPITIDEAHRFLQIKWMERQMQLRKKQPEAVEEVNEESAGELLPKKRGRKSKV